MLNLLKWEWETKLKKALMLGIPAAIVLYLIWRVLQGYRCAGYDFCHHTTDNIIEMKGMLYYLINTIAGRLSILRTVALVASWVCVFLLVQTVVSIMWDNWGNKEMRWRYLLFTIPVSNSKILAAKLLASLPLLLIIAVISGLFTLLTWWGFVLLFCTIIMLIFFSGVLRETVLAGKWYKEWLIAIGWIAAVGIIVASAALRMLKNFIRHTEPIYSVYSAYPVSPVPPAYYILSILFWIGVHAVLFFVSVYLLENKLDIWE